MVNRIILLFLVLLSTTLSAESVWQTERMEQLKTSSDPTIVSARAALVRQADKILTESPATVLDQKQVAPSGDVHDYYSMARYWWPNPKTEDGLPYIRKDGQVNPGTAGLGREALSAFQKQVEVLALAYFYTGEEAYADKCADCLRAWYIDPKTRMNPTMEYSQVVLGRDNNHGRHEGLLDTYSMLMIPDVVRILSASRSWHQQDTEAIRAWFASYVDWMTTAQQAIDEDNFRNNHGTAYHVQLIVYAGFVGRDSLAEAYRRSFTERRILTQVRPDGTQPEELKRTRGFGYSVYNLTHMIDYVDACYAAGYPVLEENEDTHVRIRAAIDFLAQFLGKTVDSWPFQQINDWDKQQQNLCWILYRADRYFPDAGYAALLKQYNTNKPTNRRWLY